MCFRDGWKVWNSNCSIHIVYGHIFSLGICFASVLCFGFNLFELIECVTVLIICLLNTATGWNYVRKCVRAWVCLCLSECEECGEEEAEKIPKIIQKFMQIMILFNSINCIKITSFFHSHFAKYTNVCVCMCFVAKQYAQHEMNALQTKQGNYHWIRNRYENKMCVRRQAREREKSASFLLLYLVLCVIRIICAVYTNIIRRKKKSETAIQLSDSDANEYPTPYSFTHDHRSAESFV